MFDCTQHFATRLRRLRTPPREPIPGTARMPDAAGGHARAVDDWRRLDRVLVRATALVGVALASIASTIAEPDDAGMLDVVGVDTATTQVLHDFMS